MFYFYSVFKVKPQIVWRTGFCSEVTEQTTLRRQPVQSVQKD
jgi:hypothetical protein